MSTAVEGGGVRAQTSVATVVEGVVFGCCDDLESNAIEAEVCTSKLAANCGR